MSVPPGTEMFQFPGFASPAYVFSWRYPCGWVAPFGYPRINACSRLPMAFRSVPRPSSPPGAKASTECPYCARNQPTMHRSHPHQNHQLPPAEQCNRRAHSKPTLAIRTCGPHPPSQRMQNHDASERRHHRRGAAIPPLQETTTGQTATAAAPRDAPEPDLQLERTSAAQSRAATQQQNRNRNTRKCAATARRTRTSLRR